MLITDLFAYGEPELRINNKVREAGEAMANAFHQKYQKAYKVWEDIELLQTAQTQANLKRIMEDAARLAKLALEKKERAKEQKRLKMEEMKRKSLQLQKRLKLQDDERKRKNAEDKRKRATAAAEKSAIASASKSSS